MLSSNQMFRDPARENIRLAVGESQTTTPKFPYSNMPERGGFLGVESSSLFGGDHLGGIGSQSLQSSNEKGGRFSHHMWNNHLLQERGGSIHHQDRSGLTNHNEPLINNNFGQN